MKTVLFAYSKNGMKTAAKIRECFPDADVSCFVTERIAGNDFLPLGKPSRDFYGERFRTADVLIFIGSCGIAVREIAPHVRSKLTDPAVICVDELGKYVIPILSGHIGGANRMAKTIAGHLDALAVITTATDINQRFAADQWAAENGMIIDNAETAKKVSAAILERDIPISSDLPVTSAFPNGTFNGSSGDIGIYIGWEEKLPFQTTLRLIPLVLHLGIGCRKGICPETVSNAIRVFLSQNRIDPRAIATAESIDIKRDEKGLLEALRELGIPIRFYSAEDLLKTEGVFQHSDFVQNVTGVDNVCERAAMLGADKLIVPKTIMYGVTLALAAERKELCFE